MLEIGFICIGLLCTIVFGWKAIISYRALKWPRAIGVVVGSYVETTNDRNGALEYQAFIKFTYRYTGKTYSGLKGFRKYSGLSWQSEKIIAEHPAGMNVDVFVNPENPRQGIIQNGFEWPYISAVIGGIFFICFGVYIATTT